MIKTEELVSFFKEVPLFNNLDEREFEQLSQICTERTFERGKVIFYEQDQGTSFYLILSGQVKIVVLSDDGREHILGILGKRDFFGEISLLDGKTRSASAVVIDSAKVITIAREDFTRLLRDNPDMTLKIMFILCERLRQADKHVETLAFLSAPGRVARILINLANDHGSEEDGKRVINHKMTRQEFANIAGTSRETLTRVLMEFQEQEILKIEKNKIIFLEEDRLQEKIV